MLMKFDVNGDDPIFMQVANFIEDNIVTGLMVEESQVPSSTYFSITYKINPATALKGINVLVDENILYKKRGLGIFIQRGAKEMIIKKRRDSFMENYVEKILEEAKKLNISKHELIEMIEKNMEGSEPNE